MACGSVAKAQGEPAALEITFDRDFASFEPGQQVPVRVSPSGGLDGEATWEWTLTGWDGEFERGDVSSAADGRGGVEAEVLPPGLGWYVLDVVARGAEGRVLARGSNSLVVAEPYSAQPGPFGYGIGAHLMRFDQAERARALNAMKVAGANWTRLEVGWGHVEPKDDQWDFKKSDELVSELFAAGIEPQILFSYTVKWASTGDRDAADWLEWARRKPEMDPWLEYVAAVVERYPAVNAFEVWNEPDISFWRDSVEDYVSMFEETGALIHSLRPDAQVLNGGLAMVTRQPNPNFVADFVRQTDPVDWDVFVYHDYHTFPQMLRRYQQVLADLSQVDKELPIHVNEGGFHTLLPGGEREQAVTLTKKYLTAPSLGIQAYVWYNLRDIGVEPNNKEHHFGLLRHNFEPKPSFAAFQRVVREIGPGAYVPPADSLQAGEGVLAHLYEGTSLSGDPDQNTLVLWREIKNQSTPVQLTWAGGGQRVVRVVDLMGNPVPFTAGEGGTYVNLSYEPVYVKFDGDAAYPDVNVLVQAPSIVTVSPQGDSGFAFTVRNNSFRAVSYDVAVQTDTPALSARVVPQELAIEPGGSQRVEAVIEHVADASGEVAGAGTLSLLIAAAGSDEPIQVELPYEVADTLPLTTVKLRPDDLVSDVGALALDLRGREALINLYSAEPVPHMQWAGGQDLSARGFFAYDEQNLYLQVDAVDDTHDPQPGERMWEADSVQFGVMVGTDSSKYLEMGVCANGDDAQSWVFIRPDTEALARGEAGGNLPVGVTRADDRTVYRVNLPWSAFGLKDAPETLRLNFLVNDNDGQGRKQWVQLTGGIAETKDPTQFRLLKLEKPGS